MSRNVLAHLTQGESIPNIQLIIETLINEGIIDNSNGFIRTKDWKTHINDIFDILNEKVNSKRINVLKKIKLSVTMDEIEYMPDEIIERRLANLNFTDETSKALILNIYKNKISLESSLYRVLANNLHYNRRLGYDRDSFITIDGVLNLSKFNEASPRNEEFKALKMGEADLIQINNDLNEIIKKIKKKPIIISIIALDFIKSFLARIDIFKDTIEKKDIINQFDIRRNKKMLAGWGYLGVSISAFGLVMGTNSHLFLEYKKENRLLPFNKFVEYFFGQGIYLLSIEFLLLVLAFYFLAQFKTYGKIVELYDSHILLIESDFFYKKDEQFSNHDNPSLFAMRKENTQKIHALPDKMFSILNGTRISDDVPQVKILDTLVKVAEEVLSKLKK